MGAERVNMITEVSKEWLEDELRAGRKYWTGRFKDANSTPLLERYFIGDTEEELKEYLQHLQFEHLQTDSGKSTKGNRVTVGITRNYSCQSNPSLVHWAV